MDKSIDIKIEEIRSKLKNFNDNKLKKDNLKKKCLLNAKIEDSLDIILETIEEFELNDINDYQIDKEIQTRVNEYKLTKEIIDVFGPYILMYQLTRNSL